MAWMSVPEIQKGEFFARRGSKDLYWQGTAKRTGPDRPRFSCHGAAATEGVSRRNEGREYQGFLEVSHVGVPSSIDFEHPNDKGNRMRGRAGELAALSPSVESRP
jgi:hypothetical protein